MRHIVPVSGKDSLATALLLRRTLGIEVEYVYNDVGADIPDVYDWLTKVEQEALHQPITRIGKDLRSIILKYNILPSVQKRYCTREAKIQPTEQYLGDEPCTIYLGIRADEDADRAIYKGKPSITAKYPLREHGIDLKGVYSIIQGYEPPTFFWDTLYNATLQFTSAEVLAALHPVIYHQLFSWRTRMNCAFCFFQRHYEWVGLLDHYPELFEEAQRMEETIGAEGYTWNTRRSLRSIRLNRDLVIRKRAKRIAKWVTGDQDKLDSLSGVASCGPLCGK